MKWETSPVSVPKPKSSPLIQKPKNFSNILKLPTIWPANMVEVHMRTEIQKHTRDIKAPAIEPSNHPYPAPLRCPASSLKNRGKPNLQQQVTSHATTEDQKDLIEYCRSSTLFKKH